MGQILPMSIAYKFVCGKKKDEWKERKVLEEECLLSLTS
jgi:hypothetical protein